MSDASKNKKPSKGKNKKKRKQNKQGPAALTAQHGSALATTTEGTLLPKEHQLYLQAMLCWHAGDWQALAALDVTTLKHHPQHIELISFKTVAHFQLGELDTAKALVSELPQNNRNTVRILISGAFNTLARARVSLGHIQHARQHFNNASSVGTIAHSQVLTHARWCEQLAQVGLDSSWSQFKNTSGQQSFRVKTIKQVALGDAWSGNTVNTVIFRHHGIFTHNAFQYTAFYVDHNTLRIVQRSLQNDELVQSDINGDFNIKDAHNSISLGMDRDGYIHISYDHHGTQLKYRRSLAPECIESWSDELAMTGQRESRVTYPSFLMPSESAPLQLLYRDGYDRKGSAYLKDYDESEHTWLDHECAKLSGAENHPWTSNAYWNHPVRDHDGSLHLSFVWRTHSIGEQQQINNLNICYAKSFDNGQSWYSSNMKPFQLPLTQVNAEVVWPISPASNLINQSSMAVDSQNRPHIVFYANDENGIVQYQHLWFDGRKWQHQYISQRKNRLDLCGTNTLRIPISRPDIIIDKANNIFVIYRGDLTDDKMAALFLSHPDYAYEPVNQKILSDEVVGLAEPVIDRVRWQKEQVLSLLIQYNEQPNHDVDHINIFKPISILDVTLSPQLNLNMI